MVATRQLRRSIGLPWIQGSPIMSPLRESFLLSGNSSFDELPERYPRYAQLVARILAPTVIQQKNAGFLVSSQNVKFLVDSIC
jgi:hypothetical protein